MSIISAIRNQISLLWRFMGFFQNSFLRIIHALVVGFVILQILSSCFMSISATGRISSAAIPWFASWYHVSAGLLTVVLTGLLASLSLTQRGFRHFFPYLWGDTAQLKQDVLASLHFKMIPPRPKGLASVVQGLGLGALLLVTLSGLLWFVLGLVESPATLTVMKIHKAVSALVELYLVGHGGMALLHFVFWQRKTQK